MLIFNTATLAVVVVVKRVIAMLIGIVYICHKLSLQFACDGNTFLSVMGVESVVVSSHELISSSKDDGYDKRIVDELVLGSLLNFRPFRVNVLPLGHALSVFFKLTSISLKHFLQTQEFCAIYMNSHSFCM